MKRHVIALAALCCGLLTIGADAQVFDSAASSQVSVNVMDELSNPAPNAWIVIRSTSAYGSHIGRRVDVNGTLLANLRPGAYTIYANHLTAGSGVTSFSVGPDESANVNLYLNSNHFYGYYHWYRLHRIGVSRWAREVHEAHLREIRLADSHGRHIRDHNLTAGGARSTASAASADQTRRGGESSASAEPSSANHLGHSAGNSPGETSRISNQPLEPDDSHFQPHAPIQRPIAPPPAHAPTGIEVVK